MRRKEEWIVRREIERKEIKRMLQKVKRNNL